jgi:integrase/recombinase XerD
MKQPSPVNAENIRRFLKTQRFRDQSTCKVYACVLRNFQHFILERSGGAPPSASVAQRWLEDRSLEWPLHMVCNRARLVDRFLEWMHICGAVPSNPFAELRRQYGHRTAPIVRALLSENVEAALQRLRPLARFGSFLGEMMKEHVAQMRSVGYRYDEKERMLLRFDRFLQHHPELAGAPLRKLVEAWSVSNPSPQHLCRAQETGRLLSKAMHRIDPTVAILPMGIEVRQRARQQERRPYIYTEDEIRAILCAAQSFPSPRATLRPLSLYTMVVLAYCAGLRLGEIVALTVADVHCNDDTIEIRDTKFFKSRRLPLPPGVMTALKHYLVARQESGAPARPASGLFWSQQGGCRYSYVTVSTLLVQVLRRAGLKPARGRVGPRIHDLRHSMVGNRMLTWYRDGINPQSHLPYLATFLGHKDIKSTLVYLNITPEVLQLANERFRQHGAEALHVTAVQS